jgi:hypothetical protein
MFHKTYRERINKNQLSIGGNKTTIQTKEMTTPIFFFIVMSKNSNFYCDKILSRRWFIFTLYCFVYTSSKISSLSPVAARPRATLYSPPFDSNYVCTFLDDRYFEQAQHAPFLFCLLCHVILFFC